MLKRGALIIQRPETLRITITGTLAQHITGKDVALYILARHSVRAALGAVIEFAGPTVAAMSMEARMTLCNMAAEMGTRYALIAPDEVTFNYLRLVCPPGRARSRRRSRPGAASAATTTPCSTAIDRG